MAVTPPPTGAPRAIADESTARPSTATRVALAATLTAAVATGWAAGIIPVPAVVVIAGLMAAAQVFGSQPQMAATIERWPTTTVGLGLIVLAIYLGGQVGFLAAALVGGAALFVLSLDWNNLGRLSLPLLLSLLVVAASLMHGIDAASIPWVALWTLGTISTLVLMERDHARGGRQLLASGAGSAAASGATGGAAGFATARAAATRRRAIEVGVITLLLLLIVPLVASVIPDVGNSSRPPRLGNPFSDQRQANPYWGFQDQLDTSVRGDLGDEVVMRVQAPAPDLWRGTTFDRWDGRTWSKSPSSQRGYPSFGAVQIRPSLGDTDPTSTTPPGGAGGTGGFDQQVTVEKAGSDLLFGAYRATDLDLDEPATVDRSDGTVRSYGPLPAGSSYTVTSSRPLVDAATLRAEDPLRSEIPEEIRSLYLPADSPVTPRVKELADTVAGPAPTTYDKVKAREGWMGAHTTYTLGAPAPPPGTDAVDQFLFVDKQGFCEQIASSLAVMLRSQGIPARVATGYAPGERNPFTNEFVEKASDAHAWVEVWFPQTGWQGFDPTSFVPLSGDFHESWFDAVIRIVKALAWWLVAALVVAVVAVVTLLVLRRRRSTSGPIPSWADDLTRRLLAAGAARGRPRREHESLIEYGDRLATSALPDPRIGEVGRTLSAALFSARGDGGDREAWASQVLDEVTRANPARATRKRLAAEAAEGAVPVGPDAPEVDAGAPPVPADGRDGADGADGQAEGRTRSSMR